MLQVGDFVGMVDDHRVYWNGSLYCVDINGRTFAIDYDKVEESRKIRPKVKQ